ncbi:MAG: carboxypeptidase regulatory-like domain-containing protein [Acidobacteriota bacterium]
MRYLTRAAMSFALLLSASSLAWSATSAQGPKETGTITGRVTVDGKPAQGVTVMAVPLVSNPAGELLLKPSASLKASTDSEGRYRLEGVPTGKYSVAPFASDVVASDDDTAKEATVAEGATAEPVDFSLFRGGVITGKVTDSEGRPVLAAHIRLEVSGKLVDSASDMRMFFTDDRGIYRIFGLRPGQYFVKAGTEFDDHYHPIPRRIGKDWTYYPGVTDGAKAKYVKVTAGTEATGVDIKFGLPDKVFTASGRVIDAETGVPIADAWVALSRTGSRFPDWHSTANARGEFRFESLSPGAYEVESQSAERGDRRFYTDPVNFEVGSANVDKLELKVHPGASITGVVVVQSTDGAAALDNLASFGLNALVTDAQMKPYSSRGCRVAPDGSFRLGGFKPGKAKIGADSEGSQKFSFDDQHFVILRIERNGVEKHDGIDIQPNEQITGVRVIIVRANCVIRGHVTIQGGPLPIEESMRRPIALFAVARSPNVPGSSRDPNCLVDAKGDFLIENLAPGDYEVEVTLDLFRPSIYPESEYEKYITSTKQAVTVSSKSSAQVALVLVVGKPPDK